MYVRNAASARTALQVTAEPMPSLRESAACSLQCVSLTDTSHCRSSLLSLVCACGWVRHAASRAGLSMAGQQIRTSQRAEHVPRAPRPRIRVDKSPSNLIHCFFPLYFVHNPCTPVLACCPVSILWHLERSIQAANSTSRYYIFSIAEFLKRTVYIQCGSVLILSLIHI